MGSGHHNEGQIVAIAEGQDTKPPDKLGLQGAIAQMGERLLCKQEVTGSIPVGSTELVGAQTDVCTTRWVGRTSLELVLAQCVEARVQAAHTLSEAHTKAA